jgi:bifunctional DNA primase/polymerase-like protein
MDSTIGIPIPTLEAALRYAELGLPVLPLYGITNDGNCQCGSLNVHHRGKHPRVSHGVHDASCDPALIRSWFNRWPDSNVGIAIPKGLFVLEIDSANGLQALALAGVRISQNAPRVRTGRDGLGLHVWLKSAFSLPNRADGQLVCDVGFRSLGSYVVAPPSLHQSGRRYAWDVLWTTPPDVPPALVALVLQARPAGGLGGGDRRWAVGFTPVRPGQQALTLISLAGRLARALPQDGWKAIPLVLADAASHYPLGNTEWPWTETDFYRISKQVCKKEYDRRRREGEG